MFQNFVSQKLVYSNMKWPMHHDEIFYVELYSMNVSII